MPRTVGLSLTKVKVAVHCVKVNVPVQPVGLIPGWEDTRLQYGGLSGSSALAAWAFRELLGISLCVRAVHFLGLPTCCCCRILMESSVQSCAGGSSLYSGRKQGGTASSIYFSLNLFRV